MADPITVITELIIVDNGSTYEPLLDYYKSLQHQVIYLENVGRTAPCQDHQAVRRASGLARRAGQLPHSPVPQKKNPGR